MVGLTRRENTATLVRHVAISRNYTATRLKINLLCPCKVSLGIKDTFKEQTIGTIKLRNLLFTLTQDGGRDVMSRQYKPKKKKHQTETYL